MEVKVIKADSLEEVIKMLTQIHCANCKCPKEETKKVETEEPCTLTLSFFIKRLAKKKGWDPLKTSSWLNSIAQTSPVAAFNIMLREIAVWLDRKYVDHIEESDRIFVISTFDGRIHEACKKYIKTYKNFAAFRTIEDAKLACNILRGPLKGMFKKNAKRK